MGTVLVGPVRGGIAGTVGAAIAARDRSRGISPLPGLRICGRRADNPRRLALQAVGVPIPYALPEAQEAAVKMLVGTGSYGISEASRFTKVNQRTAARWITGSGAKKRGRLFKTDLPSVGSRHALSFLDLIDLLVVGRFREAGVSFQTVRSVYERLSSNLGTAHPFSHHRLLTDGQTVFMETLDRVGDKGLLEVLTGQGAMPEILKPFLRQIEYAHDTHTAARWNIAPGVVLDPDRAFGKPILVNEGTTTYVLAQAFHANGQNVELVADLFDVSPTAVRQAVQFESEYATGHAA